MPQALLVELLPRQGRLDEAAVLVQLGIARARSGRVAEAAQAFTDALRINPADAKVHINLGNVLAQ